MSVEVDAGLGDKHVVELDIADTFSVSFTASYTGRCCKVVNYLTNCKERKKIIKHCAVVQSPCVQLVESILFARISGCTTSCL